MTEPSPEPESSSEPGPASGRRHTFPRHHRLSGKREFAAVFDAGHKASRGPLTAFVRENALGHPRLGLTVPRRVGNAVRRNRVKRLLREAYRHLRHDFPLAYDLVIVVRPHGEMPLAEYGRLMSALLARFEGKRPPGRSAAKPAPPEPPPPAAPEAPR